MSRRYLRGQAGYPTGEEIYAEWFKQAANVDPDAKLYINEYSVISSSGLDLSIQERYQEIIELIETNGGRIDGIGVQGHFGLPLTPPEVVYEVLEQFAATGKELSITEYDAAGVPEDLAADYMRDLLTIAFSHPSMTSFLMWGFWDGAHWKDDAPIFRQDWSLKPSGQAFFDLVFDAWWTNELQATNAAGELTIRAFHGAYEVTATFEGTEVSTTMDILPGEGAEEVTIALPRQVSNDDTESVPADFQLLPHYPEPASSFVTFNYILPTPATVHMELFDAQGRRVAQIETAKSSAGRHERVFDASRLGNGVYFYRLVADDRYAHGSLTVRR